MDFNNAIEQIKAAAAELKADNDAADAKALETQHRANRAASRKRRDQVLRDYLNAVSATAISLRQNRTCYY